MRTKRDLEPKWEAPEETNIGVEQTVARVEGTKLELRHTRRLDVWIGWLRLAGVACLIAFYALHIRNRSLLEWDWLLLAGLALLYSAIWLVLMPVAAPERQRLIAWASMVADIAILNVVSSFLDVNPDLLAGLWYLVIAHYALRLGYKAGFAATALAVATVLYRFAVTPQPDDWTGPLVGAIAHVFAMVVFSLLIGYTVKEDRALRRQLGLLAIRDGLTGLYNHRYFHDVLDRELSRAARYHSQVSLLMIDLDRFKTLNDAHGHPVGDEVLRTVGQLIEESVRRHDSCFRYGGEEFAVLLPDAGEEAARQVAERIRASISGHRFGVERVSVSIGLSTYPHPAPDKETLIWQADVALYAAKEGGRNRVTVFSGPGWARLLRPADHR